MALAVGVKVPNAPEVGHASSAPEQTHLGRKVLGTTIVSLLITGLLFYLVHVGIIDMDSLTDSK